jgi:ABC-type transport system involved in multi-copper enzyme maturation permease subunit
MTVCLIAANFLRENRWPIVVLFLWTVLSVLILGNASGGRVEAADATFYLQQGAVYIAVFSAFLASHAIYHERRSRRIQLVLSKAVSRSQYLLAILLGTMLFAAFSALALGFCSSLLATQSGLPWDKLWLVVALLLAGCALAASVVMFLSVFLHPIFALALSALVMAAPALAYPSTTARPAWIPGLKLWTNLLSFDFQPNWTVAWGALVVALIEALLFYVLAVMVFARTDVAVPVE